MPETKKPSSFSAAMAASKGSASPTPVETAPPVAREAVVRQMPSEADSKPRTRRNTRQVGGHFDPAVRRQINLIAAEEDTTVQELVAEALDMLFQSRGRATIARRQSDTPARRQ